MGSAGGFLLYLRCRRRARRTEGRGREGGLDRATRSRRGSGRGRDRLNFFYPGPLCPSLIKLIKLIHF